jgi:hypothetical protein
LTAVAGLSEPPLPLPPPFFEPESSASSSGATALAGLPPPFADAVDLLLVLLLFGGLTRTEWPLRATADGQKLWDRG